MNQQSGRSLAQRFLRTCRRNLRRPKVADSTGAELTGAGLLTRTLILRRLLLRNVLGADEQYVGVLLPPSIGAVVTNAAIALDRRIAVNLNYTASAEAVRDVHRPLQHPSRVDQPADDRTTSIQHRQPISFTSRTCRARFPGGTSSLRESPLGSLPSACWNGGSR